MKTSTLVYIGLLLVCIGIGAYIYTNINTNTIVAASSAIGDSQSTPKMAQVVANGNGTYINADNKYEYASICNNDANDRIVTGFDYVFTGLGTVATSTTSTFPLLAATSSSASAGLNSNTNYVLNNAIATSTPVVVLTGSSTPGLTGTAANRIWAAGSCINVEAVATTSSSVWIKIPYIAE